MLIIQAALSHLISTGILSRQKYSPYRAAEIFPTYLLPTLNPDGVLRVVWPRVGPISVTTGHVRKPGALYGHYKNHGV